MNRLTSHCFWIVRLLAVFARYPCTASFPGHDAYVEDVNGWSNSFAESADASSTDLSYSYDYSECVALDGIVSGGGDKVLDLDEVNTYLNDTEPFHNDVDPTFASIACESSYETPIALRFVLAKDSASFSVVQMFNPTQTALDAFGDRQTSDARRRCQANPGDTDEEDLFDLHLRVAAIYADAYGVLQYHEDCVETLTTHLESFGINLDLVLANDTSPDTPWGLARAYVDETFDFMLENDGWNADGSMSREYNRIPFSDYTYTDSKGNTWEPYVPKNNPWEFVHKQYWQPLMEDDGLGYISTQEHVTPHIGAMARVFGFSSSEDEDDYLSRQLDDPDYDYYARSLEVLEETRITATSDFRTFAVVAFDDKTASLSPLTRAYFLRNETLSTISYYWANCATQLALYNGVVMSWREKIRHDKPRPPTVVTDQLGDEYYETYAGEDGVQYIKASEWEPLIRTMPHTEYPSASACLCKVYAEQMALFAGSDDLVPSLESTLGPDVTAYYSSWSNVSDTCAQSRLWGGMHFAEAVPAGYDLCGGGEMATSIASTLSRLDAGDESAAIFKKDVDELMVRVY